MAGKPTPVATTKILRRNKGENRYDGKSFHYKRVVGKLNFLEKPTRPDIAYAVLQYAHFSIDPDTTHAQAIICIARYLRDTRDKRIIFDPNKEESLEVFADASLAGLWNKDTAEEDVCTSKSQTGYVITFAGCPVLWASKLQLQCALSTTEAEYISLSQVLRHTIPCSSQLRMPKLQHPYLLGWM